MMGRKPLPTHLKVVRGTRKSRVNRAEAKPSAGLPSAPAHLSNDAKVEWRRVAPELYRGGLLTIIDRSILAAYCQSYGRWRVAETVLAGEDLLVTTTHGNIIPNPLLGIANKAMADAARYAAELGMTPSSRSRVSAQPPSDPNDPGHKYLD